MRLCGQMDAPPHSLQVPRMRLCGQMDVPPHSLQLERRRLCGHRERFLRGDVFGMLCCWSSWLLVWRLLEVQLLVRERRCRLLQ
jgi:hypothetical protein